ncbi:MAG: hypothetical protein JXB23_06490 [Candidatus Aminicenantes bacterium]|nr:hypothetical protein [Candidatus Aminicenantes bacterium]
MKVIQSYGQGVGRSVQEMKMAVLLWVCNAFFASSLYFLVSGYLKNALGSSSIAEDLVRRFDFGIFIELLIHKGGAVRTIISAALVLGVLYFWVSVFLHGGILHTLVRSRNAGDGDEKPRRISRVFFEGAGKYFGRFFRLTLYSLLLWVGGAVLFLLFNAVLKPFTANGLNEKLVFYLVALRVIIGVFLFFLIRMILDYARVMIVRQDMRHVFRALLKSVGFVFTRLGKTLGLYYLLVLTGVVLFLIYWGVQSLIPTYSFVSIMLAFLVGQIFILSRGWLKVLFQAAQLHFFSLTRTQT